MQQKMIFLLLSCIALFSSCDEASSPNYDVIKSDLRPPAYPLITIDPYTSGWSFTDNLYDGPVKHWTGTNFSFVGAVKVDGEVYRFMGTEETPLVTVVPTSEQGNWTGKYTTTKPSGDWTKMEFNDSSWKEGPAAFGTLKDEVTAKTNWGTEFIWVRRIIDLQEDLTGKKVYLEYSHDDDVIIYINGIEVVNSGNSCKKNALQLLPEEVLSSLKKGKNIITAYCHNRVGGALLDFGLQRNKEGKEILTQTAVQKSVDVQATQTHYLFDCGNVELKVTFTAPLLMDDLNLISRPVNYISYEVASKDGNDHEVSLYMEASPAWAVDKSLQMVESEALEDKDLVFVKTGSVDQKILGKSGDGVRIDWGYFYMAADKANSACNVGDSDVLRKAFLNGTTEYSTEKRESATDKLAITTSLGKVKKSQWKSIVRI